MLPLAVPWENTVAITGSSYNDLDRTLIDIQTGISAMLLATSTLRNSLTHPDPSQHIALFQDRPNREDMVKFPGPDLYKGYLTFRITMEPWVMGGAPDLCYILGGWGSRIVLLNYSVL